MKFTRFQSGPFAKLKAVTAAFILVVFIMSAGLAGAAGLSDCGVEIDGEKPIYAGYPAAFDGHGAIDKIYANAIVINDAYMPVTNSTTYHSPGGVWGSKSSFSKGDYVAYLLDEKGQIKSLWLICNKKK